jgi:hypothetical protein
MSTYHDTYDQADRIHRTEQTKTGQSSFTPTPAKAEIYAMAEQRMRRGKQLIFSGFAVAVMGIIGYCIACFSAAANQELGAALLKSPAWLTIPTLSVIGLGTLLWLVGSFLYLSGGMDSDPDDGPDLYF